MRRISGDWAAVTALLLAAFFLRVFRLDYQAASGDDANRLLESKESIAAILQLDRHDPHPPLPFLLQHFWQTPSGMSEFAGRYLPAAFAFLAVAMAFRLALALGGRRLGLAVLALSTVNVFLLGFAQQVLPYSQLVFIVTASVYLQWRVLRDGRRRHWIAYVAVTVIAVYTHYFAFFVVLAENVLVAVLLLIRRAKPSLILPWCAGQVIVAASYVPLLFLSAILTSYSNDLVRAASLPDMAGSLIDSFLGGGIPAWGVVIGACLVAVGLVPQAWRAGGDLAAPSAGWPSKVWAPSPQPSPAAAGEENMGYWLVVCWVLTPLLTVYAISLFRPMFFERYMVVVLPAFILAAAAGALALCRIRPALAVAAVAIMCLPSVAKLPAYYGKAVYASRQDIRDLLGFVRDSSQPNAAFVVNLPVTDPMYQYYAPAEPTFFIPNPAQGQQDATTRQLSGVLGSHSEVWFTPWDYDHTAFVEHWFDQHAFRVDQHWFANAEIIRYERPQQAGQFTPSNITFVAPDAQIRVTGYQLFGTNVKVGQPIMFAIQWQTDKPIAERYKVFAHLVDPKGQTVTQRDDEPVANTRPTTSWKPGESITDNYGLVVPRGSAAGAYRIELGLYKLEGLQRLKLTDGTDHAVLGPIAVSG